MEAWEQDMSQPNPFEVKSHCVYLDLQLAFTSDIQTVIAFTQASIHLQLVNDEAKLAIKSAASPLHLKISPSMLINSSIELEDQQLPCRVTCMLIVIEGVACMSIVINWVYMQQTSKKQGYKDVHKNVLMWQLEAWATVQVVYVPNITSIQAKVDLNSEIVPRPQDFIVWLPSSIQWQVPCDVNLQEIEWKLHLGQAHNALNELRQALHTLSYLLQFKDRFLCGQGANTWAHNCLKSIDAKVDASAEKYCAAHSALVSLSPLLGKVGWMNSLQHLEKGDIWPMTAGTKDQASEGHWKLSWIWLTCGYSNNDDIEKENEGLQDGMLSYVLLVPKLTAVSDVSYPHWMV